MESIPVIADSGDNASTQIAVESGAVSRGRLRLLKLFDSLVNLFNEAEFESLLGTIVTSISQHIHIKTCLAVPPSTNNRKSIGVLLADNRAALYLVEEGRASSVVLVWMLLGAAHPDGVMKIIDRRICYQQHTPVLTDAATDEAEQKQPHTKTSTLEVVVALSGFCIAQQPLQELLESIHADYHRSLSASLFTAGGGVLASVEQATTGALGGASDAAAGERIASVAEVDTLSRLIAPHLVQGSVGTPTKAAATSTGTGLRQEEKHTEGQRRRYLIEFRLQFDEHDLVTHWTTTVLAAEPEEVVAKRQKFVATP